MARRKKPSLGKTLINFVSSALSIDSWLANILGLVKAEIRFTYRTLAWMMFFAIFATLLFFNIWILLLIALYLYLLSFNIGPYLPILIIILLNLVLLLGVILKINQLQKKLFAKKRL